MDKPKTTAKDFFLWAGAMVAFYWSVIAYTFLVFDYINFAFPNPLNYYPIDPYQSGISFEMASIIVLLPIYLLLMWFIHKAVTADSSRNEIWVRKWALILTLFVAGIAMAADLITLLTTFLNGEALTIAFFLKVAVVFLVAAGVFMHFIADLRGYWDSFPGKRRLVRIGVATLAAVTILSGFFVVGTPGQARLARFDAEKVSGLQDLQSRVTSYWQAKQKLPSSLANLSDALTYGPLPVDPQSGESYVYQTSGALSFKLCATFNTESRRNQNVYSETRAVTPTLVGVKGEAVTQDNWQHGVGEVCFDRTIDPSFYPPIGKVQL
jgi:hypothetical protein